MDQGGSVETCRPTTHADPTFIINGLVHYCVANLPGAVPRTATLALTNATGPMVLALANAGPEAAARDPLLGSAANILAGVITQEAVAAGFGLPWTPPGQVRFSAGP